MSDKIYPLAYQPLPEQTCRLYYLAFPRRWKETLLEIARANSPKFKEEYGLPTKPLKILIDSWMEGVAALAPLKADSDDHAWLTALREYSISELDTLCALIQLWIKTTYMGPRSLPRVKKLAADLCDSMETEEIAPLRTTEVVRLTREDGTVSEHAYQVLPLLVIDRLLGKEIFLHGQPLRLCYAAKNQMMSMPIAEGKSGHLYSFVFDFTVQTTPPDQKALLLCQMSIRRWIYGRSGKGPIKYLREGIRAHIQISDRKFCQIPICYDSHTKQIDWKAQDHACYDIWGYAPLPSCQEVLEAPMACQPHILLPYKNGMASFVPSKIGTGVSVVDKTALYQQLLPYLHDILCQPPEADRVRASVRKIACYASPQGYPDPEAFRMWAGQCAETSRIIFEIYGASKDMVQSEIMHQMQEKIWKDFGENHVGSCMEIQCICKESGSFVDPMEDDTKAAKIKRSDTLTREVGAADGVTACIFLLPGPDCYPKGDPKQAIRNAFARTGRVIQFIDPAGACGSDKIDHAVYDLYRQLGITTLIDFEKKIPEFAKIPCVGMHLFTQLHGVAQKARFLPVYVTVDLLSGKTSVYCDAFEKRTVSYREACLEMAQLFWRNDMEERCAKASRSPAKHRLIALKNQYYGQDKGVLLTVQVDGNMRAVWSGISNKEIGQYTVTEPYCPEQIDTGMPRNPYPLSLTGTGIRIMRIRSNQEVPDYYTMLRAGSTQEYVSASGIFRYDNVFWGILGRPNDGQYTSSFRKSKLTSPKQRFAEKDMMELYPLQLQSGDQPDAWVFYTNALRHISIQYDQSTVLPLPLHLAKALEEYLFDA